MEDSKNTQKVKRNQISKTLDKLFGAGFNTEKTILNIKLEDLGVISNLTANEINIIINFKKAIRKKRVVDFLNGVEIE